MTGQRGDDQRLEDRPLDGSRRDDPRPDDPRREDQQLAERVAAGMLAADAFSRWLGIEVVAIAPRSATVRMTVRQDMLNGFGVCHGGVTFSLADSALAFASNAQGQVAMSIENAIGYPEPVRAGDVLTARALEESASGRLAFYRVDVARADGRPVAHFRGTVYRTRRPHSAAAPSMTGPSTAGPGGGGRGGAAMSGGSAGAGHGEGGE